MFFRTPIMSSRFTLLISPGRIRWPLMQRQKNRKVRLRRARGQSTMLSPTIEVPSKGPGPTLILTHQDLPVRVDREQDTAERLSPIVAPSEIRISILEQSFQR